MFVLQSVTTRRIATWTVSTAAGLAFALAQVTASADAAAQAPASARRCQVTGTVRGGDVPLPGASVTVRQGDTIRAVTSTDVDGTYVLALPTGTYDVRVELSAFTPFERTVTLDETSCEVAIDGGLTLASRAPGATLPPPVAPVLAEVAAPAPGGRGGRGGRGGAPRFELLGVAQTAATVVAPVTAVANNADVTMAVTSTELQDDPAARLLPPGFASGAAGDAVTVNGSMVQVDRAMLNDRAGAMARGEFALGEGDPFAAAAQVGGAGQFGGGAGPGGGRGGAGGFGGRGGGGNRLQASVTYSLGGSMFDAPPYALRGEPVESRQYLQQNASTTIGGPLRIPGVYNGTNRTTFNFSYTAARNENLFDQYATVPIAAWRQGDFSSSAVPIIDPLTGNPFPGNQIPRDRMSAASLALLQYIPNASLSGDARNFHVTDTSRSTTDTFSLRVTHSLTQPQAGRGGRGGGRGGAAAAPGAPAQATPAGTAGQAGGAAGAGRGGRGAFQPPINATLTATINYRRNDGDRLNVFPDLSGTTQGNTLSVPVSLNIRAGRSVHAISTTFSRTSSSTLSDFAFTRNVAGEAGITGVATDPFDWGVPSLSFGSITALRDVAPSRRLDRSWQASYGWTRPAGAHTWRVGGAYQQQLNRTQSDSNARGTFTFTGLYTAGALSTVRGSGQDFADFLLGLPQQATRQYSLSPDNVSTPISIRGRQFSLYVQDDWRWKPNWTINYGLQYDYLAPFTETSGHMVNLDVAPDFTAAVPVLAGQAGPYSGQYGAGLVNADWNNLAPKVGVAWRADTRTVVRFGYGLSFNSGSYSTIARNLYQQPPFFLTATTLGTLADPLTLTNAFDNISESTVTNTYGIAKDYQLGRIHQYTVDYSRNLFATWAAGVTYIGTRGGALDMLRAPNRGPDGPRIEDVQAFTWQTSEGSSHMNGVSFRLQKRMSRGVSGTASYTLSKSRDNTTATGGGASVAQDDRNLDAEWALSNFDRRHQLTGNATLELPWGRGRRWLPYGGPLAAIVGDWSLSANLTWQSGTPLTVRCSSCASDVAQGVGGTLRADYTGAPVSVASPTIDQYFNTAAFAIPEAGTFGNSSRNLVIGPGSRLLNLQVTRDVTLGGTRGVSINLNVNNLLNTVNYAGVDTNVNSPTFGQVLSVSGRRSVRLNLRFRF
jgi:hypothetical protein